MDKTTLVEEIMKTVTGTTKEKVTSVIDTFCNVVVDQCRDKKQRIGIDGFGQFCVKKHGKRKKKVDGTITWLDPTVSIRFIPVTGLTKTVVTSGSGTAASGQNRVQQPTPDASEEVQQVVESSGEQQSAAEAETQA